jgi:hypothetical protein
MYHFNSLTRDTSQEQAWPPSSVNDGLTAQDVSIARSATMPEQYSSTISIGRSISGGLIPRKRSYEEQEKLSRARASHLSSLYEMSNVEKNTALNKNACFHETFTNHMGTPSLAMADPKQAAEAYRMRQQEAREQRKKDPLLTERERRSANKLGNMHQQTIKRKPLGDRQDKGVPLSVANKPRPRERIQLGDGDGIEIVYSGSVLPSLC